MYDTARSDQMDELIRWLPSSSASAWTGMLMVVGAMLILPLAVTGTTIAPGVVVMLGANLAHAGWRTEVSIGLRRLRVRDQWLGRTVRTLEVPWDAVRSVHARPGALVLALGGQSRWTLRTTAGREQLAAIAAEIEAQLAQVRAEASMVAAPDPRPLVALMGRALG